VTKYAIGVDIGGTTIKLVLLDHVGHIHQRAKYPILRDDSDAKPTISQIIQM